jgi:hypothetical protein
MKIWAYAMGGNAIEVKLRTAEDTSTSPSLFESNYLGYATIPGPSDRKTKKLRSAFHLPQTCRAIYRETAILGYALNTFVFNGEVPRMFGREDAPDSVWRVGLLRLFLLSGVPSRRFVRTGWICSTTFTAARSAS